MVSPQNAAEMARRLQSAEALVAGQSIADAGSRGMGSVEAEPGASWSERTNLQVQKMEATIEQDLSKAMAGLREQFRQQLNADGTFSTDMAANPSPEDQLSALQMALMRTTEQAEPTAPFAAPTGELQVDSQTNAGGSVASDSRTAADGDLTDTSETQSSAAVMAEFRSEAAAARDEVLGGLARLRRDLEAERARQSMQQSAISAGRGGVQAAGSAAMPETALLELRRDMMMQQAAVMEMRRDQTLWQEQYQTRISSMEQTLVSIAAEIERVRAIKLVEPPVNEGKALNEGLAEDIKLLVGRCEGIENFTRNVAAATAAKLELFEGQLASELAEERSAITRGLGVVNEMEKRTQGLVLALEAASSKHSDEMKGIRKMCEELMQEQASSVKEPEGAEGVLRAEVRAELDTLRGELATLADGLAAERMLRVQDVAGLKAHAEASAGDRATVGAAEKDEEPTAVSAGSSLVLEGMRAELLEEVSRQVRDAGVALRGHFAVGCAELRGEITARLDAHGEKLGELQAASCQATPTASQEQLSGRVDATESKLQEVFHITQLLAARYKEDALSAQAKGAGTMDAKAPVMATAGGRSQDEFMTRSPGVGSDLSVSQFVKELGDELAAREAAAASKESLQSASLIERVQSENILPLISGDLKDSLERLVAKVQDISTTNASAEDSALAVGLSNEFMARMASATLQREQAQASRSITAPAFQLVAGKTAAQTSQPQLLTLAELQAEATAPGVALPGPSPRNPAGNSVAVTAAAQQQQPVIMQAAQQAAASQQAPAGAQTAPTQTLSAVSAVGQVQNVQRACSISLVQQPAATSSAVPSRGRAPGAVAAGSPLLVGATQPMPSGSFQVTGNGLQGYAAGAAVQRNLSPTAPVRTLSPVIHRSQLKVSVPVETVPQRPTSPPRRSSVTEHMKEWL